MDVMIKPKSETKSKTENRATVTFDAFAAKINKRQRLMDNRRKVFPDVLRSVGDCLFSLHERIRTSSVLLGPGTNNDVYKALYGHAFEREFALHRNELRIDKRYVIKAVIDDSDWTITMSLTKDGTKEVADIEVEIMAQAEYLSSPGHSSSVGGDSPPSPVESAIAKLVDKIIIRV